jgi:hypothetical protein
MRILLFEGANLMKKYYLLTLFLLIYMTYEYLALNLAPNTSLIGYLSKHYHFMPNKSLSTDAGKPLSYFLGWFGFITMLITNLYIFRKRYGFMKSWSNLQGWLNFHIFCGMFGPVCIIFHSNFNVRGLVSISFWSMMVVALSGFIGRYFYVQVVRDAVNIEQETSKWDRVLKRMGTKASTPVDESVITSLKNGALKHVGVWMNPEEIDATSYITILFSSLIGDVRLAFSYPATIPQLHKDSDIALSNYALARRKELYLKSFQNLLGYWHSFHVPFAITMYITGVIHIIVASLFQVS